MTSIQYFVHGKRLVERQTDTAPRSGEQVTYQGVLYVVDHVLHDLNNGVVVVSLKKP